MSVSDIPLDPVDMFQWKRRKLTYAFMEDRWVLKKTDMWYNDAHNGENRCAGIWKRYRKLLPGRLDIVLQKFTDAGYQLVSRSKAETL